MSHIDTKNLGFDSKVIHSGAHHDAYGSATVPIYQTSTFAFDNAQQGADRFAGTASGFIYTRLGNPTINALERQMAELEGGFGGIAMSSGMGSVSTVYLALLDQGAHMVGSATVYGPSRLLAEKHLSRFGVESTWVDTSNLDSLRKAMRPNTKMVYTETVANPTMDVTDIRGAAEIAHANNALLVVDNTFASPYLHRPIEHGADVVLHSVTKFLNGHADVVGGVVVPKTEALFRQLRPMMTTLGCNMDPHQAYLVIRGIKTLALRIERAQANAMRIAQWLEQQPQVEWVRYIGLPSHPQHELAKVLMSGFGSMIAFELKGGLEAGRTVMDSVKLATLAVSLGGVESLIEHPASMTHAGVPRDHRIEAGITDGLVRYSVGIEDVDDLIADLAQALDRVGDWARGKKAPKVGIAD
ncbi:MAG: aminotransferase class I/II-fold pyridoxal phosphate-dependent enzyme [Acidobacteria bacterium]|nr:aminotransferase class I/II-fold pyridoxal phosphate-dependent enzyme [Acidobacteriota bacterium]